MRRLESADLSAIDHINVGTFADALGLLGAKCVCQSREAESGMEDCECADGNDDHDTLKSDEVGLLAHELASPSTGQLGDTVDASGEDGCEGENETGSEATEFGVVEELHGIGG